MSILKEIPPTAGFPLYFKDILSAFFKKTNAGALENNLKAYLKTSYAQTTYSGTAALYLILETIKKFNQKKTVIIPAFICPLVPLAIKRAGLKIKVCDIQKNNFNFNYEELKSLCTNDPDILAVVPTHLAGIAIDMDRIIEITKNKEIYIIEDCAQSLGAEYKGKKIGTFGDFAFFSLCRGKGLTIYEGGVITTNKQEFAVEIDKTINELSKNDFFSETLKILELFGYWLVYRPQFFWWAYRLPQIFWNLKGQNLKALAEYYTVDFDVHNVSNIRKKIGYAQFSRLESEIEKQREKTIFYLEGLKQVPGIKAITEASGDKATYPYLTILFDNTKRRDKAFNTLSTSGLGIFQIYASAITDYDYLKNTIQNSDCPNARHLASRHLTLSTSTYLSENDLRIIIKKIKQAFKCPLKYSPESLNSSLRL